jgi:aldose 1-epimerase
MKRYNRLLLSLFIVAISGVAVNCKGENKQKPTENTEKSVENKGFSISKTAFGTMSEGQEVQEYTLKNEQGMQVSVINYGGRITHLIAPDKNGTFADVVVGFDSLPQYQKENPYFGALIGRYGNRIANGKFSLDGKEYQLPINNSPNSLHGGDKGFDKVFWQIEEMPKNGNNASLKLSYTSKDMEMGYPGTLKTTVIYTLTNDNSLEITYKATTDKKTVLNLTQHTYFNLSGDFSKPITDHIVTLAANTYLPVDKTLIPTGELRSVKGTPFDFREAKTISKEINADNEQLKIAGGYDHCWVLNDQGSMRKVASAYHETSGRFMEVMTDQPAIQFYTGNFLDGTLPQRGGNKMYAHRTGFCLETQHYPDSPNQKEFPTTVLNPGETYNTTTSFKFSTK